MCEYCGKRFEVPPSRLIYSGGRFCSVNCRNQSQIGKSINRVGDGHISSANDGYLRVKAEGHPFSVNGYVRHHRMVIEEALVARSPDHHFLIDVDGCKYLRPGIEVHHVNEDKADNRIENLIACTPSGHRDLHRGKAPMKGEVWPEPECAVEAEDRWVEVKCAGCGDVFSVKRSTWKKRGAKYCSNHCASGYSGNLPAWIERSCEVCNSIFTARRSRVLCGGGKYCSIACSNKAKIGKTKNKTKGI